MPESTTDISFTSPHTLSRDKETMKREEVNKVQG